MLVTEIEVIAQPLVIVRTLPSHHVPLRQTRFVAPGEFWGDGEYWRSFRGGKAVDECYAADKAYLDQIVLISDDKFR
jgi:hypothetical protein